MINQVSDTATSSAQLEQMRSLILSMGGLVETAITDSTTALTARDVERCRIVVEGDVKVNEIQREVRELSFAFLLKRGIDPRDLREVLGMMHMTAELERMGDHCVNVARIGRTLADLPDTGPATSITSMSTYCSEQLHDMLGALVARDVDSARAIAARDDRIDRVYQQILDDLIESMVADSAHVYRSTNLILAAHNLERIADRVTNLAEDLVFLETGNIEELG
jgi:phosphate transport system protein